MYQLQLNELKNVNRELREKNLRLTRDMDQQQRQQQQLGADESDREEKASLPSNYPSAPSSFTSRYDGEIEEVGGDDDDDEGGIETEEKEEPDSVSGEDSSSTKSSTEEVCPIAIETKKI